MSDAAHLQRLCDSFQHWTGESLASGVPPASLAAYLDVAPFALLSHDNATDPRFNYANATALRLFGYPRETLLGLPSRLSAEATGRSARDELMARVTADGHVRGYRGVRIAADGHRFVINNVTLWNIIDGDGRHHGQAACFDRWHDLQA